jgi:hypothetical protein
MAETRRNVAGYLSTLAANMTAPADHDA